MGQSEGGEHSNESGLGARGDSEAGSDGTDPVRLSFCSTRRDT